MSITAVLGGVLNVIGAGLKGFFGIKEKKADVLDKAIQTISTTAATLDDKKAAAAVLVAEAGSDSWLTRMWRPITMMVFLGLLVSYWYGYAPPNIHDELPPAIDRIFTLIEYGIYGYIGSRTLEKIVMSINLTRVIGKFLK